MKNARFSRQILLTEIGESGQVRLEAQALLCPLGLAPFCVQVAELYGERTGLELPPIQDPTPLEDSLPSALQEFFKHPGSREVGLGAATALRSALIGLGLLSGPLREENPGS